MAKDKRIKDRTLSEPLKKKLIHLYNKNERACLSHKER